MNPLVKPLLRIVYKEIEKAKHKKVPFILWAEKHWTKETSIEQDINMVVQELREKGYTAKFHNKPDPNHPTTCSYWEINFK